MFAQVEVADVAVVVAAIIQAPVDVRDVSACCRLEEERAADVDGEDTGVAPQAADALGEEQVSGGEVEEDHLEDFGDVEGACAGWLWLFDDDLCLMWGVSDESARLIALSLSLGHGRLMWHLTAVML